MCHLAKKKKKKKKKREKKKKTYAEIRGVDFVFASIGKSSAFTTQGNGPNPIANADK